MQTVSVVIATYHRERLLVDTIASVLHQTYPNFEVIVVDQCPRHEASTIDHLRHWQETAAIRWVILDEPSLTHARNVGWRGARGEIVVFIDDDVRIDEPTYLQAIDRAFAEHPEVGGVAGRIVEPGRDPETVASRVGDLGFWGIRKPGFGSRDSGPAYSVRGCNMAFRRQALAAVGGFDEGYTRSAYREDTDIGWRLRRQGYGLWFAADAWLWHLSAPSGGTRDLSIEVEYDIMRNDLRFAAAHLTWIQHAAWRLRLYASRVVKAGLRQGRLVALHQAYWRARSDSRSSV